ncbi:MAG TPA: class I tRNA ligase family protein [Roseiflexaceae bacterium]|nr:class I tRNA ligase family protein [Roseiflexaceae bacterium]
MNEGYHPQDIERRWQEIWYRTEIYEPDIRRAARPYYNLMMFPYPSAAGLHIGNLFAFVGADIHGRFMAMNGQDVFEPIGFDAFGIHSENYAIKQGIHPKILTARYVERFRETQLKVSGNRYDWSHAVDTTAPQYYRWTQWIFVQLFKAGLAERKSAAVNWCPSCLTVLANEQVIDGLCERCDTQVVQRELEQWFFKITSYAQRLLDNLEHIDWSEVIKIAQRNWIGRSVDEDGNVSYRLRDWLISRQRYWGPPIPIVYCDACGTVPVPEDQLPVLLPEVEDWKPTGTGSSPLAAIASFVNTTCPACGGPARRETDVSDNFLDSAWYFLRYPSTECGDRPFDAELTAKWLPVDMYIGGREHAVLHLMYTRFIAMALHDLGHLPFEEPFKRFRAHGTITKDGAKISKSRGNVINPDEYIAEWGADTVRTYLMFMGPYTQGGDFSDRGISGIQRFLNRVWNLVIKHVGRIDASAPPAAYRRTLHQTIQTVTEDTRELGYNTAIAALMQYVTAIQSRDQLYEEELKGLLLLLAPFAPHIAEELWERIGQPYSIHQQPWPAADAALLVREIETVAIQINGRTRATIDLPPGTAQAEAVAAARQVETIERFLKGSAIQRAVYVPGRIINLVVAD